MEASLQKKDYANMKKPLMKFSVENAAHFFVSDVHVKYHLGFNHDTRCVDCYSYCERSCSEKYALKAELAGKVEMEMGLAEKKTAIPDADAELKDLVKGLTNSHKETFQNMLHRI